MSRSTELHDKYWKPGGLDQQSPEAGVSLDPDHANNPLEFYLYGCRLADYLVRRFEEHAARPLMFSEVLEIGCGMGRIVHPLSGRFRGVHGMDISETMLQAARHYTVGLPNVHFYKGNGFDLSDFPDARFDYVYSTGVLQHINDFGVIASYLREGLRVLKPSGTFLFSFQTWQQSDVGEGRNGARITANRLDQTLAGQPFVLKELSQDPLDPVPHMVAVVQKAEKPAGNRVFRGAKIVQRPWRTAIVEDLETKAKFLADIKARKTRRSTFFDE